MAAQNHKVAIGAFTLLGALFLVLALIFLGGGKFFKTKTEYVLYFEGSVSGLSVGAPVVFRGVPLGSVTRISLVFDRKSSAITIPVFIHLDESSIVRLSGEQIPETHHTRIIQHMVRNGLSARLEIQNLITGQYRVELDYHNSDSATVHNPDLPNEIPTVPSPMDALQKSLAKLPLQELTKAFNKMLMGISHAIGDGESIRKTIDQINTAFISMEKTFTALEALLKNAQLNTSSQKIVSNVHVLTDNLARDVPKLMSQLDTTVNNFAQASERFKHVSAFTEQLMSHNSPAMQDLRRLFKEAADAARSLHNLADMLNRTPEALLHGKKGNR